MQARQPPPPLHPQPSYLLWGATRRWRKTTSRGGLDIESDERASRKFVSRVAWTPTRRFEHCIPHTSGKAFNPRRRLGRHTQRTPPPPPREREALRNFPSASCPASICFLLYSRPPFPPSQPPGIFLHASNLPPPLPTTATARKDHLPASTPASTQRLSTDCDMAQESSPMVSPGVKVGAGGCCTKKVILISLTATMVLLGVGGIIAWQVSSHKKVRGWRKIER